MESTNSRSRSRTDDEGRHRRLPSHEGRDDYYGYYYDDDNDNDEDNDDDNDDDDDGGWGATKDRDGDDGRVVDGGARRRHRDFRPVGRRRDGDRRGDDVRGGSRSPVVGGDRISPGRYDIGGRRDVGPGDDYDPGGCGGSHSCDEEGRTLRGNDRDGEFDEIEERSFYENDDYDEELYDRGEWKFDGIDFDQIRHPEFMQFENDVDYYDADEEEHPCDAENVPMQEVSFVREQDEEFEYRREENTCHSQIDDQNHDEVCTLDSDCDDGRRRTSKTFPGPNFRSSESLDVIRRIESVMESLIKSLDGFESILRGYVNPESREYGNESESARDAEEAFIRVARTDGDAKFYRNFDNIAQSRSFSSICCVMSFVHQLLLSNRTTTTREVYYVFVTHFRNQRECDDVILDVAKVLGVSRRSLGLSASPKGWFCGCVEITRRGTLPSGKDISGSIDGTALLSVQGLPITREWTERDESGRTEDGVEIRIASKLAKAILVIEKEGVYNRLSEERIFDRFPCILVTGKGFPDLATRALVSTLHRELELPVIGLCDCNPYGVSVLAMYLCAGGRMGIDGMRRYTVPIRWLGLRPSEVAELKEELPETVFQKLTDLDYKRITSLLDSGNPFLTEEDEEEVRIMGDSGYKVELEALYWLGPDHMGDWVVEMLEAKCDYECEQQLE